MGAFVDLTGKTFGRLTVQSRGSNSAKNGARWLCLCTCGTQKQVDSYNLRHGNTKSCGCLHIETSIHKLKALPKGKGRPLERLEGQTFGLLTVLYREITVPYKCVCRCVCGNTTSARTGNLKRGSVSSCGCKVHLGKHGQARKGKITLEYTILHAAKRRAKLQGMPFNLDLSDIIIPDVCPVLGIPLSRDNKKRPANNSPSIDKFLPSLGYVKGNIQIISYRANWIKQDSSLVELEALVQWMKGNTAL